MFSIVCSIFSVLGHQALSIRLWHTSKRVHSILPSTSSREKTFLGSICLIDMFAVAKGVKSVKVHPQYVFLNSYWKFGVTDDVQALFQAISVYYSGRLFVLEYIKLILLLWQHLDNIIPLYNLLIVLSITNVQFWSLFYCATC